MDSVDAIKITNMDMVQKRHSYKIFRNSETKVSLFLWVLIIVNDPGTKSSMEVNTTLISM